MDKLFLRKCPFCGSTTALKASTCAEQRFSQQNDFYYTWWKDHYSVVCSVSDGGCGASVGEQYNTLKEAVDAWNRRATDGQA